MSITLFCLVKGNTPVNAFSVKINRDEPINLKLWKVEIPDDRDSELANPALEVELLATKKISKYFPDLPAEECIHVIVEPPVSTTASSREQELLDRIASLEASINKSVHDAESKKVLHSEDVLASRSLPETEVSVPDEILDSNLESPDDEKSYDEDVNQLPVDNTSDADKDFYISEEYNFGGALSDDNDEDVSLRENANATRDNENDDEFSDNNEEEGFYGFSDDDDEGYYYDLNTGETCTKSNLSIYAY
ncbi:4646_t:CDS:2 [Paraglomus brasilianum]|uniref:4646_t:CDS:1 n=1 Tax=Paraglomus brasilianum TaxID=144538 RepID=A0A9N9DK30_9GLOM|nr:4646_t:CDS:2 [Paraglomus brasilianum]